MLITIRLARRLLPHNPGQMHNPHLLLLLPTTQIRGTTTKVVVGGMVVVDSPSGVHQLDLVSLPTKQQQLQGAEMRDRVHPLVAWGVPLNQAVHQLQLTILNELASRDDSHYTFHTFLGCSADHLLLLRLLHQLRDHQAQVEVPTIQEVAPIKTQEIVGTMEMATFHDKRIWINPFQSCADDKLKTLC